MESIDTAWHILVSIGVKFAAQKMSVWTKALGLLSHLRIGPLGFSGVVVVKCVGQLSSDRQATAVQNLFRIYLHFN